jgi:hypothetical protein
MSTATASPAADREAITEPPTRSAGRHRVHRIRHLQAAGPGPGAGDDGLPAHRAAPLARGAAVPPGRHERRRQRAPGATAKPRRSPRCRSSAPWRFRVRDARSAYRRVLDRGAWEVPTHPEAMELNIPAIHGVGGSRIYFVDRYKEFSIYDVDFVPIPTVDQHPPAVAGIHFFGVVQYIGVGRSRRLDRVLPELFGLHRIPDEQRFGILPKGKLMRARPCGPAQCVHAAADRARGRCSTWTGASACSASAWACPTCWPRAELRARGMEFVEPKARTPSAAAPHAHLPGRRECSSWCTTSARRNDPRSHYSGGHRRLRHGHHLAGRPAGGQAGGRCARPASAR